MNADGEKWRGIGRKGWQRVQWAVGLANAFGMVRAFDGDDWLTAAAYCVCVLYTACWRLPSAPPIRKGEK